MRANGFTLIELLAAMVAGSLLLASMSWAISRLSHDLASARRGEVTRQLLTVSDRLSVLLSGARAAPSDNLSLSSRQLTFVTNPPMSLGAIGLVTAELNVEGQRGDERLEVSLQDADGRRIGTGPSVLLAAQQEIRFEWVGGEGENARTVAIRIVDQDDQRHDLMVPLKVDGDANCQFDPISMACR